MKGILRFLIELAIAITIVTFIVNCQNNQGKSNVSIETTKAGQFKSVYYDYQDYMNNRNFKNN